MHDALVLCGGEIASGSKSDKSLCLDVSPNAAPETSVAFSSEQFRARFGDDLPDVIADAVELAVYVFAADRLVRRGASASASIGAEWQRKLHFKVAVRRPEVWNDTEVLTCLHDVLTFLSGDQLSFEFTPTRNPAPVDRFLGYNDPNAQVIKPQRIILFSGGLDSLAGVVRNVAGRGEAAILVAHRSSKAIISRQDILVNALGARVAPGKVFYAPTTVRRGADNPVEPSQRLRSFLFAALGMAHARMFELDTVHFFENGITSFNLPIAEHVVGTRASRTTHPRVLAGFGKLFSLLLGQQVRFVNPFLWNTKADVLSTIAEGNCADLISLTTSCARVRDIAMTGMQCGCCSQCVERRLAVLATGLDQHEPPGTYAADMFIDAFDDSRDLAMIEGHVLRAHRFATMSDYAFLSSYGQVFRALPSLGGSPSVVAKQIYDLHKRYGKAVMDVVDGQLRSHSGVGAALGRAPTCLVAMINAPTGTLARRSNLVHVETMPVLKRQQKGDGFDPQRIILAFDRKRRRVIFEVGAVVRGKGYEILQPLEDLWKADRNAGRLPKNHSYLRGQTLAEVMETSEENLRQQVARLRKDLLRQFEERTDYTLDSDDIVQSVSWRGYRLSPYLVLVAPTELASGTAMSRDSRTK